MRDQWHWTWLDLAGFMWTSFVVYSWSLDFTGVGWIWLWLDRAGIDMRDTLDLIGFGFGGTGPQHISTERIQSR